MLKKIGFGGGCHWCTEAVFSSIKGVKKVEQGWIASLPPYDSFSEAVIVHYNPDEVTLVTLIEIHLETHSSTSNHNMRKKYRSAIYYFDTAHKETSQELVLEISIRNKKKYITQVLPFNAFKKNKAQFLQYFEKNKDAPFCKRYIDPKINHLKENFINFIVGEK